MLSLVLRRLALTVPLLLGVLTLVFVLLETSPGEPVDLILGERPVPPEIRERIERAYGFDQPPLSRYLHWISAFCLRGELGWSHSRSRPVATLLRDTLPPTLLLTGSALTLHVGDGLLLGIVAAARRRGWPDRLLTWGSLFLYAMPTFWLGLMAILLLAYAVPLFPASSMQSVDANSWPWLPRLLDRIWHLALPVGVLGLASAAAMTRFVRSGLLEALGQEFIRGARARGVGRGRIMVVHALRNALGPVVNLVGLSLPVLVSGSLVTEVVFSWPGMGRLTYDAILAKDLPVVLVTTLLAAVLVVVGNLAADLMLAALDPRIRLGAAGRRP